MRAQRWFSVSVDEESEDEDEKELCAELDRLSAEISEWRDGATLVRESHFEEYARGDG